MPSTKQSPDQSLFMICEDHMPTAGRFGRILRMTYNTKRDVMRVAPIAKASHICIDFIKEKVRIIKKTLLIFGITIILFEGTLRLVEKAFPDTRSFYQAFNIPPDNYYWEQQFASIPKDGYIAFDENLGWSINPNKSAKDSLYVSNSMGIRSYKEYSLQKTDQVVRIAVFGDSFTHGDDVKNEDTWSFQMERWLNENGVQAEVVNFGVSGYGMGQAYLRYKEKGQFFNPDIVLFGFQSENFWRNLNVFRPNVYLYSGIPFSKPRAYSVRDSLVFANKPVVSQDSLWFLIEHEHTAKGPLLYEYFHHNTLSKERSLLSKFYVIKVFSGIWSDHVGEHKESYSDSEEGIKVMQKILSTFESDVRKSGGRFIIGQLPNQFEVEFLKENNKGYEEEYINGFLSQFEHIISDTLLAKEKVDNIFEGHYSVYGNRLIGEHFGRALIETLR